MAVCEASAGCRDSAWISVAAENVYRLARRGASSAIDGCGPKEAPARVPTRPIWALGGTWALGKPPWRPRDARRLLEPCHRHPAGRESSSSSSRWTAHRWKLTRTTMPCSTIRCRSGRLLLSTERSRHACRSCRQTWRWRGRTPRKPTWRELQQQPQPIVRRRVRSRARGSRSQTARSSP